MTGAAGQTSESRGRGRGKAAEPPIFRPGPPEVLTAIESLYIDEVRPQGRILLKRLAEQAAAKAAGSYAKVNRPGLAEDLPRIDANRLRKVCERCRQIAVHEEESGEYCALLVGRSGHFVDACANVDDYPREMWQAASEHFSSAACEDMVLPGGRYACAQALSAQRLPFLEGFSLGRICHIVQLAISRRHILGYLNGQVVPYGRSEAVVKERCAKHMEQAVLGPRAVPSLPLATLEQVREGLRELLADVPGQPPVSVPLPNVKRLFRSRFNLDLSETALGQSRLCELLQDPRFQDICDVNLQGNGYAVTRPTRSPRRTEAWTAYDKQPQKPTANPSPSPTPQKAWPAYGEQAAAPEASEAWPGCECLDLVYAPQVQPAHDLGPTSPEAWPTYYGQAADAAAATSPETWPSCGYLSYGRPIQQHAAPEPAMQVPPTPEGWPAYCGQATAAYLPLSAPPLAVSGWEVENHCAAPSVVSQDDSSTVAPSTPMPEWPAEWAVGDSLDSEPGSAEASPCSPATCSDAGGLALCEELPLGQDTELAEAPPASTPSILLGGRWSALMSPSVLADDGCIGSQVKNTFIHISSSSRAACEGSRRRASSLPRCLGSSRSDWEAACHGMLFLNATRAEPSEPASEPASEPLPLAKDLEMPAPRPCWSPGAAEDADGSTLEALRLWGCEPPAAKEAAAEPQDTPWRPSLRHHQRPGREACVAACQQRRRRQ